MIRRRSIPNSGVRIRESSLIAGVVAVIRERKVDLIFLALGVLLGTVVTWHFMLDDGLITLRYSRNLLDGYGPNWNHSGPRVEGYTSFLFMISLAAAGLLKINLIVAAKVFGSLCLFAAAVVAYLVIGRRTGSRWASMVGGLAIAWSPAMWLHAGSTLETTAYGLVVVALVAVVMAASPKEMVALAPLSLAAALLRPEGIGVAILAHIAAVAFVDTDRRAVLTRFAGLVVLPFLGYVSWRWVYYGYPLPNTVYVKGGDTNLASSARWFRENFVVWLPVGVGSAYCLKCGYFSRRVWAATTLPLLAMLPYGLSHLVTDFFHRFMSLCYPALVVSMVVVLVALKSARERIVMMLATLVLAGYSAPGATSTKNLVMVLAALLLLSACVWAYSVKPNVVMRRRWMRLPLAPVAIMAALILGWHARGIEAHVVYAGRALDPVYGNFGRALSSGGPNLKVAVGDAGAIPYFSRAKVYDIAKLNDAPTTHGANPRSVLDAFDPDVLMLYSIDGVNPIVGQKGFLDITNLDTRYTKRGVLALWKTSFANYGLVVYTKSSDLATTRLVDAALQRGRWAHFCPVATWSCTLRRLVSGS